MRVITAGDYTAEFRIKRKFYEKFKEVKKADFEKSKYKSWARYFQNYIKNEMEERLTN